jgi:hypothetical protein
MESVKAAAAVTMALWVSACAAPARTGPVVHEHHRVERGAATRARVVIDMGAGELAVQSGAAALFEGDFDFNAPGLKPAIAYAVEGATGTLKVSQGSVSGNYENAWRLNLNDTTPLDLEINMGAGDADLVLGRLNLDALDIQLGAVDVVIDLRVMPARSYRVTVQAGAGDTTVHLPAAVGISARTSGFIGDTNVSGLEKRDGRWINARAAGSPVIVDLEVQHAIGDLRISAD